MVLFIKNEIKSTKRGGNNIPVNYGFLNLIVKKNISVNHTINRFNRNGKNEKTMPSHLEKE